MNTMSLTIFLRFQYIRFTRYILGRYSLYLVNFHIKMTPTREDVRRDMLLEHIRFRQRTIEQKRHKLWVEMCSLAKLLGIDDIEIRKAETLIPLETETKLANGVKSD